MKKIKILTIALAIITITMITFFGVYTQVQNRMENQVKKMSYAMDLEGNRSVRLKVNNETKTIIKDAQGNEVTDSEGLTEEQIAEKGYVKEETPAYNSEEVKNVENYKESKKVIEKRLEELKVENYNMKLDEKTGDIVIELSENEQTDSIVSNLTTMGKFEILDAQTNEVLIDNSKIKQAKVMYGTGKSNSTNNGTSVYLEIEFDEEGAQKLEEITSQYVKTENTSNEEETTNEEKKVTLKIDDEEIISTAFEEPIRIGKLQLSVGNSTTDMDTLQGYIEQASNMATVLDTGKIPVKYDLEENQYILSDITDEQVTIAIYVAIGILVIGVILLFIKNKIVLGALGTISYIGFLSLLVLVLPYANVVLSIEGFVGMAIVFVLNYILIYQLLAKVKNKKEVYKEFFIKIIPIMIMTVTFCFIKWTPISSFGMVMFWGITLMAIYNGLITNTLLKINAGKEK